MDLINETNSRIQEILDNLAKIKREYEEKIAQNKQTIQTEVQKSQQYKDEFYEAKAKVEKMNSDIEGFQNDYQNLVDKFKDDELANILIAANKEISAKIEERKRKILKDREAMNELVKKAENVKAKLVKLTAEKKALELCLRKILDAYFYYTDSLNKILTYSAGHSDNLSSGIADIDAIIADTFELDEKEIKDQKVFEEEIQVPAQEKVEEPAHIEEEKVEPIKTEEEIPQEKTVDTDFQNIYLDTIVLDEVEEHTEKVDANHNNSISENEDIANKKNKKNKKNKNKNNDLEAIINSDDSLDD